jgi:hypothetical protein
LGAAFLPISLSLVGHVAGTICYVAPQISWDYVFSIPLFAGTPALDVGNGIPSAIRSSVP